MLIIEMRMKYQRVREKRFIVVALTLTGMLFLIMLNSSLMFATTLQPVQALQQSQITTCGRFNSCQTIVCTNNESCHTFQSNNDPSTYEQPQNDVTVMQPLEDTATVSQPEEDILTQPSEGTEGTTMAPEDDMEVIEGIIDN
jgi:hypothetical protein